MSTNCEILKAKSAKFLKMANEKLLDWQCVSISSQANRAFNTSSATISNKVSNENNTNFSKGKILAAMVHSCMIPLYVHFFTNTPNIKSNRALLASCTEGQVFARLVPVCVCFVNKVSRWKSEGISEQQIRSHHYHCFCSLVITAIKWKTWRLSFWVITGVLIVNILEKRGVSNKAQYNSNLNTHPI